MKKYIYILLFLLIACPAFGAAPTVEATFESISYYWTPASAGGDSATCQYKVNGAGSYEDCQAPIWDSGDGEYRGSIVGLTPDTNYDIHLDNGTVNQTLSPAVATTDGPGSNTTWSESPTENGDNDLPDSNTMYTISSSGSAGAYDVYRDATIDVNDAYDYCIKINDNVHHVIIRNITCLDASIAGIYIGSGVHDVFIENNNISNWGDGTDRQAGVYTTNANPSNIYNIVVQRNTIHDPRVGANDWSSGHPSGPQGLTFRYVTGGIVVRYNTIYSSWGYYYNDGIGGSPNGSTTAGAYGANSDIYGNHVQHAWDDGLEIEGMNKNVRVWGNYVSNVDVPLGIAGVGKGPLYVWRNIFDQTRKSTDTDPDDYSCFPCYGRGGAIKSGYNNQSYNRGPRFIYHNTTLQHSPDAGKTYPLGSGKGGIADIGGGGIYNTTTRNNIVQAFKSSYDAMNDGGGTGNDFDYDLYWPDDCGDNDCATEGYETHGINSQPTWKTSHGDDADDSGLYQLESGANGHDDGAVLVNFNDNYEGLAPDMGAHEYGSHTMEFGINAGIPTLSSALPSGEQSCSEDPLPVNLQVTTNKDSNCKWDTTDHGTDYDSYSNTFSNTGGTLHTTSTNVACGTASDTYYYMCQAVNTDTIRGYVADANTSTSFSVSGGSPPDPPPAGSGGQINLGTSKQADTSGTVKTVDISQ